MSRVTAMKALLAQGISADKAKEILDQVKGGPKGADMERGWIYFLPGAKAESGQDELFLTYGKAAWNSERFFNGAICLTATARSEESELVEAKTATGADSIRSAYLGEAVLTVDEANKVLLAEIKRRKATQPQTSGNTQGK